MSGRVERNTVVSKSGMTNLDEALSWAVQTVDSEFGGASMIQLTVQEILSTSMDPQDGWAKSWTASVSGMTEEDEPAVAS